MELYTLALPQTIIKDLKTYEEINYKGTLFTQEVLTYIEKPFDLSKKIDIQNEFKNISKYIKKLPENIEDYNIFFAEDSYSFYSPVETVVMGILEDKSLKPLLSEHYEDIITSFGLDNFVSSSESWSYDLYIVPKSVKLCNFNVSPTEEEDLFNVSYTFSENVSEEEAFEVIGNYSEVLLKHIEDNNLNIKFSFTKPSFHKSGSTEEEFLEIFYCLKKYGLFLSEDLKSLEAYSEDIVKEGYKLGEPKRYPEMEVDEIPF